MDNNEFSNDIIEKYGEEGSELVCFKQEDHPYQIFYDDLVSTDTGLIRHDAGKIEASFRKLLEVI